MSEVGATKGTTKHGSNGTIGARIYQQPLRGPPCSMRVTTSENGITNAIEIARTSAGQLRVICSNNDCVVRLLDAETFRIVGQVRGLE